MLVALWTQFACPCRSLGIEDAVRTALQLGERCCDHGECAHDRHADHADPPSGDDDRSAPCCCGGIPDQLPPWTTSHVQDGPSSISAMPAPECELDVLAALSVPRGADHRAQPAFDRSRSTLLRQHCALTV